MDFATLTKNDFNIIANSAAESVANGKCKEIVLVNCSTPDIMILDPVCLPREYKHLTFELMVNDESKEFKIYIGND